MLKRLFFAVTLAASTLLVTGAAQASDQNVCAAVKQVAPTSTTARPAPSCMWRGECYMCYSYRSARWDVQHCNGGSEG
ncbi:hypothetical protein Pth03_63400 [Planotetraspora thailandica]|uniref:Uncharacterized protein n=1 Tax=Planotetraspora thailandica TaxID=487172 RepID=A0A8J3XYX1_9ACTN|nr:hypothetical protein [Planotetraspora thailandica]GII57951.1 hypothetical protein Pth03_63400 [Planotetraspora thailandica]